MKAFVGKLLVINLTNNDITDECLDEIIAKDFLGGAGYCCKYLYDKLDRDTDPLSPKNILNSFIGIVSES